MNESTSTKPFLREMKACLWLGSRDRALSGTLLIPPVVPPRCRGALTLDSPDPPFCTSAFWACETGIQSLGGGWCEVSHTSEV